MKKHIYLILLLVLVSSCLTLERAVNKVTENEASAGVALHSIKEKQPLASARFNKTAYPIVPKTTIVRDTILEKVVIPGDSIECPPTVPTGLLWPPVTPPKPVKVKCPDVEYYTKTIIEQSNTISENTAALLEKELELDQKSKEVYDRENDLKAEKEAHAATIKANKPYRYTVWTFFGLALLFIAYKVYKMLQPKIVIQHDNN